MSYAVIVRNVRFSNKKLVLQFAHDSKHVHVISLRSLTAPKLELVRKLEIGTFQDQAAQAFNELPAEFRNCSNFAQFSSKVKIHLLERTS